MSKFSLAGMAPLFAAFAFCFAGPATAGPCQVVTDGTGADDASIISPLYLAQDISGLTMETDGDTLIITLQLTAPPNAHPSGSYSVYWTDSNGGQYYFEGDLNAALGNTFAYGTWQQGDASIESDEIGPVDGAVEGSNVVFRPKLVTAGNPAQVSALGRTGTSIVIGAIFSDVTDEGLYTIGDSCGKAEDYFGAQYTANSELKDSDATTARMAASAGAGSLGWLGLVFAVAGLRRRFSQ